MPQPARYTLSFDVGGSNIKAALLGKSGDLVSDRSEVETPSPLTPASLVRALARIGRDQPHFDRIAVGVPGIVHRDVIYSLPVAGRRGFKGFALGAALTERLGVPVRLANDATMQGLASIRGAGVEMVITLGTGLGTALFVDGCLNAHYQTLPGDGEEFGSAFGDAARRRLGTRRWNGRVRRLLRQLRTITGYDRIFIGGGNSHHVAGPLPRTAHRIDNIAGVLGGHFLWEWGEC